jgi:hypothetical protein
MIYLKMEKSRREFIKKTGLAGLAMSTNNIQTKLGEIVSGKSYDNNITFLSPIDGDMLNEYDGTVSGGALLTKVKLTAAPESKIRINGAVAVLKDGFFQADVPLKDYKNVIEAVDNVSGEKQIITVFRLDRKSTRLNSSHP